MRPTILPFLVSFFFPLAIAQAQQVEFAHPELVWHTIETDHFLVHYHEGAEWSAREAARIAEQVYVPITELYRHKPDQRVSIVIRDHDDYSNGAAYFYDNKIEIWAPALDFELRGTHRWLENVITHEFTHIVQIQTAMKLGRTVPAVYLQWLGYEAERRPDVLYGFPNILASYPLSAFVLPTWFAEGVAQVNHPELTYDGWDTHRDMILRMAILDDTILGWEEMAVFGKNSLGNEASYNAGFAFVEYLVERYGPDRLREISRRLGALHRVTVDGAIRSVIGKSGMELYEEWKLERRRYYQTVKETIGKERGHGTIIEEKGFGNFYPAFAPGGKRLAYVSTQDRDYFSQSVVMLYDVETGNRTTVTSGVRSTLSFSPDGRSLYYARATRANPFWSRFFDIYRYDLQAKRETRLTHGQRAMNPKLSPDGTQIVFVTGSDGTTNIAVCDADGRNVRVLTGFSNGEQVYTPVWSPDGKSIAFGYSEFRNQWLATLQADGSGFRIVASDGDARNPSYSPDGRFLLYACDRSGIFNIYSLELSSGVTRQVTNVLGGAFLPALDEYGNLAYAEYTSTGYKIALLSGALQGGEIVDLPARRTAARNVVSARSDGATPNDAALRSRPYRNVFTSLSLIPLVRVDNYNPRNKGIDVIKPGFYFSSTEMLGKLSLFGGAAANRKLERDLFLIFEYADRVPLLFQLGLDPRLSLEVYNSTRTISALLDLTPYLVETDITYNLLEFNAFLRHNVANEFNELRLGFTLSRYSADIGSFFNPNDNVLYAAFRSVYLIANVWSARFDHNGIIPSGEMEINPLGRTASLRYGYEANRFNPEGEYEVRNGLLVPVYTRFNFHRVEVLWNEHLPMPVPRHTFSLALRAGSILGPHVDEFFDFYAGGFAGMRGYPYYAIGGNEVATVSVSYRFPLWRSIDTRVLQMYFTKLYGSVFASAGDAWSGRVPPLKNWKRDVGFELRLEAFSFYVYPTRIFFSGAYGFDRFSRTINNIDVVYGREWRFYLGVLFGFEISQLTKGR